VKPLWSAFVLSAYLSITVPLPSSSLVVSLCERRFLLFPSSFNLDSGSLFFTMRSFALVAAAAALVDQSLAGYVLEDDYMTDFFGGFDFFDKPDPTNGASFKAINKHIY
jgi:hypothetical protein